ncbi:MAG TPA: aldose 1-epimerase [Ginsengibacter sp.]
MFSIDIKKENGFEKFILRDNDSNTFAVILPACGATLHAFVASYNGTTINVIDSYESPEDFIANQEAKGFLGSKLSPFVCRLHHGKYHFGETEYKFEKYYLGKSAIHGIVYNKVFKVTGETANELHASLTMKYEYRGEEPGYPFYYDCIITWQLEKDNKLSVTTECINKDKGLIPMQDGWHPYFNLCDSADELQLEFQSKEVLEFNSELIPTQNLIPYVEYNALKIVGNTFFDNCYTLNMDACQPMCVLRNQAKKIEIEIHPEKSYPYLQVYIPPHRKSIAIENLSGAPDAFNNGMGVITLEPGESALFKTSYKIKFLN